MTDWRYRDAVWLAEGEQAWLVATLAWVGMGAVHRLRGMYEPAATAYRAAAESAKSGTLGVLQVDALHMLGSCLLSGGDVDHAVATWQEALQVAGGLDETERQHSGCAYVRRSLKKLHRRGHHQALLVLVEDGWRQDTDDD
jgi:hypothetical protein